MDDTQKKFETKDKGYLFKNKRKNKQAQPDWTGKINWKGEELSIAAWEKTSQGGEKFLSLALSEVYKGEGGENGGNNNSASQSGGGNPQGGQGGQNYSSQQYEKKKPNTTAAHPDNDLNELNDLFE